MSWDIAESQDTEKWYDFDSAAGDALGEISGKTSYGYLQLFSAGCKVEHGWNCTAACLDTSSGMQRVWNNTYDPHNIYTLANCIVLPFITNMLATGKLNKKSINLTHKHDIPSNADLVTNASAGWPVINNCINSFCETAHNTTTPGCAKPGDIAKYVFYPSEDDYEALYQIKPGRNVTFSSSRVSPAATSSADPGG